MKILIRIHSHAPFTQGAEVNCVCQIKADSHRRLEGALGKSLSLISKIGGNSKTKVKENI